MYAVDADPVALLTFEILSAVTAVVKVLTRGRETNRVGHVLEDGLTLSSCEPS